MTNHVGPAINQEGTELPRRVLVIGCGGAGKTTLANQLGTLLDLPVTHLDPLLHDQNWRRSPPAEFKRRQQAVMAGHSWIIDGTYPGTLPIRLRAADTIILLDLPALACLWGIVKRRLRYGRGQHPNGVFGTASWPFLRHVMAFRRRLRPAVLAAVAKHGTHARLVRLTSRRQVRAYLAQARTAVDEHNSRLQPEPPLPALDAHHTLTAPQPRTGAVALGTRSSDTAASG